jgi:hypothetical protein
MGLQFCAKITTKLCSQMTKKLLGMVAVAVFCSVLVGCTSTQNSVQGYSIRSYQGPLPMQDLRYVNAEAYGVPVNPR